MNDEFDKEINSLYQQRKATITPPPVCLNTERNKIRSPMFKPLLILLFGSVSSFSILALMSHLAKLPETEATTTAINVHEVVVVPESVANKVDNVIIVRHQPLPEQPVPPNVPAPNARVNHEATSRAKVLENQVVITIKNEVSLPALRQPKTTFEPVIKISPEYPNELLKARKTGNVKLRYQVMPDGSVGKIEFIESQGDRQFRKAAKTALSQWKYNDKLYINEPLEVWFEFQLVDE